MFAYGSEIWKLVSVFILVPRLSVCEFFLTRTQHKIDRTPLLLLDRRALSEWNTDLYGMRATQKFAYLSVPVHCEWLTKHNLCGEGEEKIKININIILSSPRKLPSDKLQYYIGLQQLSFLRTVHIFFTKPSCVVIIFRLYFLMIQFT